MTDKEIAICKEIISDLNIYCALTSTTCKSTGFEFSEEDFERLNHLTNLIYRQKAEIDKLKVQNAKLQKYFTIEFDEKKLEELVEIAVDEVIRISLNEVRVKAIREFAEKLKRKSELLAPSVYAEPYRAVSVDDIDNLVKEMTEGSK